MTEQRDAVIREWMTARDNAAKWAARERQLRDYIAQAAFGYTQEVGGMEGSHKLSLGNGFTLKLLAQTKYEVADGVPLRTALEYARDLGTPLPKPLCSWKPSLSLTAYKAADDTLRRIIMPAVTAKPQAPQLDVEFPK